MTLSFTAPVVGGTVPPRSVEFASVAGQAQRRIDLIHFCQALRRFAWLALLGIIAVVALRLCGVRGWDGLAAAVFIGEWLVVALGFVILSRPSAYAALGAWDAAAGRKEIFSSAFVFEQQGMGAGDPGRALHLERARELLVAEGGRLARDLPLPRLRWTWLAPSLVVIFALSPWLKPELAAGDAPLTADMIAAARAEADKLVKPDDKKLQQMKDLTQEEKRKLEELQKSVQTAAEGLKKSEGKTPREVLAELEKRARAAEELGRQLGSDTTTWASDQMLGEMRKHADTADLANAIKDKNAGHSADEARKVARQLKDPKLTSEAAGRMKEAVSRTTDKATDEDKKKMVGQHLGEADKDMKEERSVDAGEEFQKLADKFARLEQRENAQKELQKLAERLRQSGSSIMGQSGQMKKLAGHPGQAGSQSQEAISNMTRAGEPGSESSSQLPVPGLGQLPSGQPGQSRGSPVPGAGPPPKNAKLLSVVPGTGKPGKGLPLAVPIPGTAPGKGGIPIPGEGVSGQDGPTAQGGLLAGRGHIDSDNTTTKPNAATAQGVVTAAPGTDGESFLQTIEGQERDETAARAAKKTASEFLKVQEEAFDEQSLPPSRREQVRRYFEAIRKKFEE